MQAVSSGVVPISITPDRIQAAFKFHGMYVPTISRDRHSRFMTMKGSDTSEETCTAVEPDRNRF